LTNNEEDIIIALRNVHREHPEAMQSFLDLTRKVMLGHPKFETTTDAQKGQYTIRKTAEFIQK